MRVLLGTNILISYLLVPHPSSPISQIVRAGVLGEFDLLFPEELLNELARKVREKRYLSERITPTQFKELVDILAEVSETIPRITTTIPAVTRDPKDDYLLAYALVGQADYLVTGDDDLLSLGQVDNVRIVTPRRFSELLKH
jgi:hypothetical protein